MAQVKAVSKELEDEIIRRFSYDSESGEVRYKVDVVGRGMKAGDLAGVVNQSGYRLIKVIGRLVGAHRMAWFMFYGSWPVDLVDHIDGDKLNNAISNLRSCSKSENSMNKIIVNWNKTSQYFGVHKKCDMWRASIKDKGKKVHLGYFTDEQDAAHAYNEYVLSIGDNFRPMNLLDRHEVK